MLSTDGKRLAPFFVGGLACLIILALCFHGIERPRGLALDFANYYDAGRKAVAGQFTELYDPFALIEDEVPFGEMSFLSAPITSYFYAPLAALEPYSAAIVFKTAITLCQLLALILLFRHLAQKLPSTEARARFFAIFSCSALIFMPFWMVYWVGGQTTPVAFLMIVIALITYRNGRVILPAAALCIAVLIKPFLAPGMIFILIAADKRMRVALLALGATIAVISILAVGIEPHLQQVEKVLAKGGHLDPPQLNSNMLAWIEPSFLSLEELRDLAKKPAGLTFTALALKLFLVGVLLALYVLHRRPSISQTADRQNMLIVAAMISLIIAPTVWSHYLAFLFIPLMFAASHEARLPFAAKVIAALAVLTSFFQHPFLIRKYIEFTEEVSEGFLATNTWGNVFLISIVKSLPMLLTYGLVAVWWKSVMASSRLDPATQGAPADTVSN